MKYGNIELTGSLSSAVSGGSIELLSSIVPDTSGTLDLGSPSLPFKDLYLTNNSLHLGVDTITSDNGTLKVNGFEVGTGGSSGSFNPASPTVYNVLDYGADNTGVLETRQKIQDAIDDINTAAEPAVLYFPSGTYSISANGDQAFSTTINSLQIVGDGIDETIFNVDLSHPSCTRFWLFSGDHYQLRDFTVDGSDTGTANGFWCNVATFTSFDRVRFIDISDHAIFIGTSQPTTINKCHFTGMGNYAIGLSSADSVTISDNQFSDNNGDIQCDSGTNYTRIYGNVSFNPTTNPSINVSSNSGNILISGNRFQDGVDIILQIDGDKCSIVGNEIDGNAAGTSVDINGDNNTFVGNVVDGDVLIDVASTNNYVADNVFVAGQPVNSSSSSVSIYRESAGQLYIDNKVHAKSFEVDDLQYTAGGESVTPDLNFYGLFEYTLNGDITLNAPSNMNIGQSAMIVLTQGTSGSHILTVDSSYLWEGGTEPTWTTSASATDVISVVKTTVGYISAAMLDVN